MTGLAVVKKAVAAIANDEVGSVEAEVFVGKGAVCGIVWLRWLVAVLGWLAVE